MRLIYSASRYELNRDPVVFEELVRLLSWFYVNNWIYLIRSILPIAYGFTIDVGLTVHISLYFGKNKQVIYRAYGTSLSSDVVDFNDLTAALNAHFTRRHV